MPALLPVKSPLNVAVAKELVPADVTLPVKLPVTLPVKLAVIVPAAKSPLPSRATTLLAVFALVASTASVNAALSLPPSPPVRYDPFVILET